jgi:hypothetical protein
MFVASDAGDPGRQARLFTTGISITQLSCCSSLCQESSLLAPKAQAELVYVLRCNWSMHRVFCTLTFWLFNFLAVVALQVAGQAGRARQGRHQQWPQQQDSGSASGGSSSSRMEMLPLRLPLRALGNSRSSSSSSLQQRQLLHNLPTSSSSSRLIAVMQPAMLLQLRQVQQQAPLHRLLLPVSSSSNGGSNGGSSSSSLGACGYLLKPV